MKKILILIMLLLTLSACGSSSPEMYTITFHGQGGTPISYTIDVEEYSKLPSISYLFTPQRGNGYIFAGYFTHSGNCMLWSENVFRERAYYRYDLASNNEITLTEDLDLYACWIK